MLKKGELHAHLNGAIPTRAVHAILEDEETELPAGFDKMRDLTRRQPSSSLAEYLKPWQVLRLIPRKIQNLDFLSLAVFESLSDNNVQFVELRTTVLYLAALQETSVTEALQRIIEATGRASLYSGIERGLVLTVNRGSGGVRDLERLLNAYENLGCPPEVVGIDLAGDEEIGYPRELPTAVRDAKNQFGLGVTIHAGETGRVENIRSAIQLFDADRIGHGTAIVKDQSLMDCLADRDICVEVCPISNRLTSAVKSGEAHPLLELHLRGVPFVIGSDNPGIHAKGLNDDFKAAEAEGLPSGVIYGQYDLARRYSFLKGLQ